MDTKEIEKFIKLAKDNNVQSLEYKNDNEKFYVSFGGASASVVSNFSAPVATESITASATVPKTASSDGLKTITSPFVGTFYRSASPDTKEYVSVGSKVSKGQPLCIVEAMKIMNEIESDLDGEIAEICVENETYVEFGQVLFKLK